MTDPSFPEAEPELVVELNALLGRGTHYDGNLAFEGRVRIEGRFTGEIRGDVLIIGEGAEVAGDIEVGTCIITGGQVEADIRARDGIELHAPATVRGDLHAPNVFIDRGVQFEGGCKMAPLEGRAASSPSAEPSRPDDAIWAEDLRRVSEPEDDAPVLDPGAPAPAPSDPAP